MSASADATQHDAPVWAQGADFEFVPEFDIRDKPFTRNGPREQSTPLGEVPAEHSQVPAGEATAAEPAGEGVAEPEPRSEELAALTDPAFMEQLTRVVEGPEDGSENPQDSLESSFKNEAVNPDTLVKDPHTPGDWMPHDQPTATGTVSASVPVSPRRSDMSNVEASLKEAASIDGAVAVALVDYTSGMSLGSAGDTTALNLDVAAAGNTDVVRAKLRTMEALGLKESIEDVLITLSTQYHMIRLLHGSSGEGLFLYLVLDKTRANLAMARHKLSVIERNIQV